jgi:hypothetical protein
LIRFIIFATPFHCLRTPLILFILRHYDAAFDYAAERFCRFHFDAAISRWLFASPLRLLMPMPLITYAID